MTKRKWFPFQIVIAAIVYSIFVFLIALLLSSDIFLSLVITISTLIAIIKYLTVEIRKLDELGKSFEDEWK